MDSINERITLLGVSRSSHSATTFDALSDILVVRPRASHSRYGYLLRSSICCLVSREYMVSARSGVSLYLTIKRTPHGVQRQGLLVGESNQGFFGYRVFPYIEYENTFLVCNAECLCGTAFHLAILGVTDNELDGNWIRYGILAKYLLAVTGM